MKYSKVLRQDIGNVLNGPTLKIQSPNVITPLVVRLAVPKISVPTILDPRFTKHIKQRANVTINPSKIMQTHEQLPFDVLECNDVPMNRLETFAVNISKLINCKDIDSSFKLDYGYRSDLTLKTKMLIPTSVLKYLRANDDNFRNFNSDKLLFVESLNSDKETALQLNIRSQSIILDSLKMHLWKDQQLRRVKGLPREKFDTVDHEILVFLYRDLLEILKNKIAIEHQTGCSIVVPKYSDRYNMDDLLEVYVYGSNRFNTVKGIRNLSLYRSPYYE